MNKSDWTAVLHPHGATEYYRIIDGRRVSFTITDLELFRAGSRNAAFKLQQEKAAAAIEAHEKFKAARQ